MRALLMVLVVALAAYLAYVYFLPTATSPVEDPAALLERLRTSDSARAKDLAIVFEAKPDALTSTLRKRAVTVDGTISGFHVRGIEGTDIDLELATGLKTRVVFSTDFRRYERLNTGDNPKGYRFVREGDQLLLYAKENGSMAFVRQMFVIGKSVQLTGVLERSSAAGLTFHWQSPIASR